MKAVEVAKYILNLINEDYGETISNLKLQKILYYIQGYFLAYFDKPLFEDKIVAWAYGPVVPSVYNEYKKYGNNSLPVHEITQEEYHMFINNLSKNELGLIQQVFETYIDYYAYNLVNMTHSETPWNSALIDGKATGNEIDNDIIKFFFKSKISKND